MSRSWFTFRDQYHSYMLFLAILFSGALLLYWLSRPMIAVIISIVLAYLLSVPQRRLEKRYGQGLMALMLTICLWSGLVGLFVWLMPKVFAQSATLLDQYPVMHVQIKTNLGHFFQSLGFGVEADAIHTIILDALQDASSYAVPSLQLLLSLLPSLLEVAIYFFLVPMMVFFLLRDRQLFLGWFKRHLPVDTKHFPKFWREVDEQLGNYLRGKSIEVLVVALVSVIFYQSFSFQYALLFGLLTGFSVLIPIFGAMVVTMPLFVLAWAKWGSSPQLWGLLLAHSVILLLDAQFLVPLLFSKTLSLHPFVIVLAILFFGGIWGFWGLVFAIPLATVIRAIMHAR